MTERHERAQFALNEYGDAFPDEIEPVLSDLLTDLMHLARHQGEDFKAALLVAKINFNEEA